RVEADASHLAAGWAAGRFDHERRGTLSAAGGAALAVVHADASRVLLAADAPQHADQGRLPRGRGDAPSAGRPSVVPDLAHRAVLQTVVQGAGLGRTSDPAG